MDTIKETMQAPFRQKSFDRDKLLSYGFTEKDGEFLYRVPVADGQFTLAVSVKGDSISTDMIENDTGEPYALYLVEAANGAFVGRLRAEALRVLTDVAEKCCFTQAFKSAQTEAILRYAEQTYGDSAEFLWADTPDCAIVRRKDTNAWYILVMTIPKMKLGIEEEGKTEIVDLRALPDEVNRAVDGKTYFKAYHMNKTHWYTMCLNDSVPNAELFERIDESYRLAKKK